MKLPQCNSKSDFEDFLKPNRVFNMNIYFFNNESSDIVYIINSCIGIHIDLPYKLSFVTYYFRK